MNIFDNIKPEIYFSRRHIKLTFIVSLFFYTAIS